jgi:hypothetical protein
MRGKNGFWNIRKCGFAAYDSKTERQTKASPCRAGGSCRVRRIQRQILRPMDPSEGATKICISMPAAEVEDVCAQESPEGNMGPHGERRFDCSKKEADLRWCKVCFIHGGSCSEFTITMELEFPQCKPCCAYQIL